VETQGGKHAIGAGFSGLYNTYHRNDLHTVHFYVRSTQESGSLRTNTLPRPGYLAGTYLFNFDGNVYATEPDVKVWDNAAQIWKPTEKVPEWTHG